MKHKHVVMLNETMALDRALARQAERGLEWALKQEVLREECPPGGGKGQRRPIKKPGRAKKGEKRK